MPVRLDFHVEATRMLASDRVEGECVGEARLRLLVEHKCSNACVHSFEVEAMKIGAPKLCHPAI